MGVTGLLLLGPFYSVESTPYRCNFIYFFAHDCKSLAELAAEDPKLGCALASKEHNLYLSFLGPNNPPYLHLNLGLAYRGCQCGTKSLNHKIHQHFLRGEGSKIEEKTMIENYDG